MNPRHRRLLIPGLLIALIAVVVIASVRRADGAEVPRPEVVSTIDDARIIELSGLATSRTHDGLAYAINDSGSAAVVHAVDVASGDVVGTSTVSSATWLDPEALSIDADGTLWVADTGDNLRRRDAVALWSFAEPGPGDHAVEAERHEVTLPDGPMDVEALLIDPRDGTMFLVSKGFSGRVLALDADFRAEVVADGLPSLITDATFTDDGRAFVLGYTSIHELDPDTWTVLSSVAHGSSPQAEALTVVGARLVVGTEGRPAPLTVLDPPSAVDPEETNAEGTGAESEVAPDPADERDGAPSPWWVAAVAAGAIGLAVAWVLPKRR